MDNENYSESHFNDGRVPPSGMAFAMRAEAESVLGDAAFRRSPIIAKLLRFLIEETLAGKAHLLKSYTVAIDGLGRSAEFDVGDSYARVQMGRLRKMLQSHYAEHGPVDELCLYLQLGCYTIKLGQLKTAYPTLYRPLSAAVSSNDRTADVPTNPVIIGKPRKRFWLRPRYIGVLIGILLTIIFGLLWQLSRPAKLSSVTPILELGIVEHGNDANSAQLARLVQALIDDGLPRFKMARVRLIKGQFADTATNNEGLVYSLSSQIEASTDNSAVLSLRLNDVRTNTLIWSRQVAIPSDSNLINDAIAPLVAEISGPHGVIATQSTIAYKDDNRGGYPCLTKYFSFLKTRDSAMDKLVSACFEKPVNEAHIRANTLAARALFALDSRAGLRDPKAALAEARMFANQAISVDANDGAARFAMARIAYKEGDCVSARFYTQQTVEANPYSPIFMAGLAGHAPQCRYEKSGGLLDRAFLVANAGDTDARLLLVIAAVAQKRADRVSELAQTNMPRHGRHRLNHSLSETIIAASEGRNGDAVKHWKLFSKMRGGEQMSPDEKLQEFIQSPALRRQVLQYLKNSNVFPSA